MAHGITFVMYERETPNTRGEAAIGARKALIQSRASLTMAFDQHRYGHELIAQIYTTGKAEISQRRADGYNRVQVYLGPLDEHTADMLEQMAEEIRATLRIKAHA
jgi:hypothetical protein